MTDQTTKQAVFAAVRVANDEADARGMDRAGVDICAQVVIAAYLTATGRAAEAENVRNVIT